MVLIIFIKRRNTFHFIFGKRKVKASKILFKACRLQRLKNWSSMVLNVPSEDYLTDGFAFHVCQFV